jgi:hypothetical protein
MGETEGYETIKLQKSAQVSELLQSRHILDDEVKMVIDNAEFTGGKLYQPGSNKYLAKLRIGEVTFYVEYSVAGETTYEVHTAYSHRTELEDTL